MRLIAADTTLETPRLLLEPLVVSHAAAIYEQLLDQRVYQFIPTDPPTSLQVLETRYRALSSRLSPDKQEAWLNWVVRLRDGGYVGTLEATVYPNHSAAIAYLIFPPFWRQGYAKEGCVRLLAHLLQAYEVNIVVAEIDTRNVASIGLIETLGFERISTKMNADFFKGAVSHEHRYERVSSSTSLPNIPFTSI